MQRSMFFIERFRATIASILLLIFATYFANISLFSHYHIVDGVTIVHSHFHDAKHTQNPSDTTTHTKSGITLIHAISNYLAEAAGGLLILGVVSILISNVIVLRNASITNFDHIVSPPLRGPPAELLIG